MVKIIDSCRIFTVLALNLLKIEISETKTNYDNSNKKIKLIDKRKI